MGTQADVNNRDTRMKTVPSVLVSKNEKDCMPGCYASVVQSKLHLQILQDRAE